MTISIKICGLKDKTGIESVIREGANYAGFIYFPASRRHITLEAAADLKLLLPSDIKSVSVLVDPDDAFLARVVHTIGPDYIQFHGAETPQRLRDIRKQFPSFKVIKAISIASDADLERSLDFANCADILLFDAKAPLPGMLPGGNGLSFDWSLLKGRYFPFPWMLSGGLNAINVAEAIRVTDAKMIDVSSGVESSLGVKEPALIQQFVSAVRHA